MFCAGLDLSRKRVDVCVLDEGGEPIRAAIESMNGARFVHDALERCG
jgi:hypothetical protein